MQDIIVIVIVALWLFLLSMLYIQKIVTWIVLPFAWLEKKKKQKKEKTKVSYYDAETIKRASEYLGLKDQ